MAGAKENDPYNILFLIKAFIHVTLQSHLKLCGARIRNPLLDTNVILYIETRTFIHYQELFYSINLLIF